MGKSLYRTYRSASFAEIIGQDHIVKTLQSTLQNNAVSHAYLLSGPRGVGKTSIARILAYAVNDQPYRSEATNLDIIEIDAASNRRIDEIREIKERVHIAPAFGKFKVYIIDEVHMLTREAFNALLKTLEEPPSHAIFILATTESHKVPDTIRSRCIQLKFKPISKPVLVSHLKQIAQNESITIDIEALELLADHSDGSFRDSLSLLEQASRTGAPITSETVSSMLGLTNHAIINSIVGAIALNDLPALHLNLNKAYESGATEAMLASQLINHLRTMLLGSSSLTLPRNTILTLQRHLLDVSGSASPRIALEICLVEALLSFDHAPSLDVPKTVGLKTSEQKPVISLEVPVPPTKSSVERTKSNEAAAPKRRPETEQLWPEFLTMLKKKNNTLYGIARMAEVDEQANVVRLAFNFAFHHKQMNESKNRQLFSQLLEELNGAPVELHVEHKKKTATSAKKVAEPSLENVSNIFGSHEVLES